MGRPRAPAICATEVSTETIKSSWWTAAAVCAKSVRCGAQSIILSSGRAPNGRYYFDFNIYCEYSSVCNNIHINIVIDVFMPSYLNLISPGSDSIQDLSTYEVYIPYPIFQWSADYCRCSYNRFKECFSFHIKLFIIKIFKCIKHSN